MRWIIRVALATLLVVLLAPTLADAQRRDRNRISQEEILAEKSLTTTYDIVKMLRPQWFRVSGARTMRGSGSADTQTESAIVLYVDGIKMQSVEPMNSVPPARVQEGTGTITGSSTLAGNASVTLLGVGGPSAVPTVADNTVRLVCRGHPGGDDGVHGVDHWRHGRC